ncbi:MAG: right-handed parallel beta-helix repeat-containing protein [Opitutaceae bacterium]|nr:right-handed parallel beta-helix repeat-containing protein [Opitutaceae bacterium]
MFRFTCRLVGIIVPAVLLAPLHATVFFVDAATGDDANDGQAPRSAWRSLERVSAETLQPGDCVLLSSSAEHHGTLSLTASGSEQAPITIDSFGSKRAVIRAGQGDGIRWTNASWITIRNLEVIGSGLDNNGSGILIENTRGGLDRQRGVRIERVRASGFSYHGREPFPHGIFSKGTGIYVGGNVAEKCGFDGVTISDCEVTNNTICGILVGGAWKEDTRDYSNAKVHISGCRAWSNPGLAHYDFNWSGSGIVLDDTDTGVIEHCSAWDNGKDNPPKAPGGPCGIWTHSSRRITIQYCVSFRNVSNGLDGAGFDFDAGVRDSVLRRNLSFENRGAGYLIYTYAQPPMSSENLLLEGNVSIRDGQNPHFAGVFIQGQGSVLRNVQLRENVLVSGPGMRALFIEESKWLSGVELHGNVIVGNGGEEIVKTKAKAEAGSH